jgi:hypothetical protein
MTGDTTPVTGVGTEVRVITIWPRGEPIAVVTGWIAGARPCNVDPGTCNRVTTGPAGGFDPAG